MPSKVTLNSVFENICEQRERKKGMFLKIPKMRSKRLSPWDLNGRRIFQRQSDSRG